MTRGHLSYTAIPTTSTDVTRAAATAKAITITGMDDRDPVDQVIAIKRSQ